MLFCLKIRRKIRLEERKIFRRKMRDTFTLKNGTLQKANSNKILQNFNSLKIKKLQIFFQEKIGKFEKKRIRVLTEKKDRVNY
jgi:hypothetical protein